MGYWPLKQRQISPIGLDIGHATIKMVQIAQDRQGLHVLAAQRCPYPQDHSMQTVRSAIRRLWEAGRFRGRKVVAAVPCEGLRVTSVRLSDSDMQQTPEQLYQGLTERFGLRPEQETITHIPVGCVQQAEQTRNEVILMAADNADIDERVNLLLESGLKPVGLDPVACALFRCYDKTMQRREDSAQSLLYIDIGAESTTIAFGRQHTLCFVKQLPVGAAKINERAALALGVDRHEVDTLRQRVQQWILSCEASGEDGLGRLYEPETGQPVGLDRSTQHMIRDAVAAAVQELAHEIALCMRYYSVTFRGQRAERILLSGGIAQDRILQHSLGQTLGIEVIDATPFDLMHLGPDPGVADQKDHAHQWAVALGLAFKGLDTTRMQAAVMQKRPSLSAVGPL